MTFDLKRKFKLASTPFFIFKFISLIISYFNNLHYRSVANIHQEARILFTGKIINIRGLNNSIQVGSNTVISGELLTFAHGGTINIGEWCYLGENSRIWSAENINIGNRVLISHNVNIHDTDGHPINSEARHQHFKEILTERHPSKDLGIAADSIIIEDDVWIGFNSTILKGVNIGKGAIIGASSVVTKDVPPCTMVAGNPAKFIRHINQHESNEYLRQNQPNNSSAIDSTGTH
jgi:acetyltransferase-like isoleucine patch superfamily enzyme